MGTRDGVDGEVITVTKGIMAFYFLFLIICGDELLSRVMESGGALGCLKCVIFFFNGEKQLYLSLTELVF